MKFIPLTFDRDHTHAGKPIKRGEKRDIPAYNADWLIANGIAHPTPARRGERAEAATPATDIQTEEHDHVD